MSRVLWSLWSLARNRLSTCLYTYVIILITCGLIKRYFGHWTISFLKIRNFSNWRYIHIAFTISLSHTRARNLRNILSSYVIYTPTTLYLPIHLSIVVVYVVYLCLNLFSFYLHLLLLNSASAMTQACIMKYSLT